MSVTFEKLNALRNSKKIGKEREYASVKEKMREEDELGGGWIGRDEETKLERRVKKQVGGKGKKMKKEI